MSNANKGSDYSISRFMAPAVLDQDRLEDFPHCMGLWCVDFDELKIGQPSSLRRIFRWLVACLVLIESFCNWCSAMSILVQLLLDNIHCRLFFHHNLAPQLSELSQCQAQNNFIPGPLFLILRDSIVSWLSSADDSSRSHGPVSWTR